MPVKRKGKRPAAGVRPRSIGFLENRNILILTLSEWEGPRRIRQHLTDELVKRGNRVLFVEANFTLAKFVRTLDVEKLFRFRKGHREVKKNLFVLSAPPFLPGGEFSAFISRINWWLTSFSIRKALKNLEFENLVLWIYAYNAVSTVGRFGEQLSLYFCNDAFAQLYENEILRRRVIVVERRLIKKVDAVITVSDKLTEERKSDAKKIFTIYHGVDYSLYANVEKRKVELNFPRPIIGYSGVIRHIIDLDLLEYVAVAKPQWSLVLVGPVAESDRAYYAKVEQLKQRANVHFLGSKSPEELPGYIHQFDMCLLPYTRGEVSTYYSAPLKFFEYLAAGKPVVSTVGPYAYSEDVVLNAKSREEFVEAIVQALRKKTQKQIHMRRALAKKNSWQQRAIQVDQCLKDVIFSTLPHT